jgi:diaminohydroxyphosphoribosylaminopyrimidine deaminase/5-amino-6-(5-phosphoribosylamino)uracil reductase
MQPSDTSAGSDHERFMRRAIELARNGAGHVSPNPLVGCVIVHRGRIVSEGWHKRYGGPHAEVEAVQNLRDRSILHECSLYVNLEPCSHTGKTPPCADMIIRHGIGEVVFANEDPNPLVAGNGARKLRDAGIRVTSNVLSGEGYTLNKRFFTYMKKRRPFVILKWAETADGFIARENFDSKWISDEYSRRLVHKWRTEEDSVLVGRKTAEHDNPMLNVRGWTGRNPVRIVIDRNLKLGTNLHLFDGTQRTICYNTIKDEERTNVQYIRIDEAAFTDALLDNLFSQGIQSVIVEGGQQILQSFIESGLWDEARIFISPKTFEKGVKAPVIRGRLRSETKLADDWLKIIEPSE